MSVTSLEFQGLFSKQLESNVEKSEGAENLMIQFKTTLSAVAEL